MLARSVREYCIACGDEAVALAHDELDIAFRGDVFKAISGARPDTVFNCAAYTNVDGAESDTRAAHAANAIGPENLAAACKEFGATFVTISTDYVFDGTKDGFYTEDDPPNPQSVYARTKYEGERRSTAANSGSIVVRSGWIFGHGGTNFLSRVPELVARGQSFKAVEDAYGTATYAGDLAVRLRELAEANVTGVFHAANSGEGCSYHEFAAAVAERLGHVPKTIGSSSDAELERPAARPRNSRLRSVRSGAVGLQPMRGWQQALQAFLKEKGGRTPPIP